MNRVRKSDSDLGPASFLTAAEVASMLGVSTRTVHRFCADGRLPQPTRCGTRLVRWDPRAIETYLAR